MSAMSDYLEVRAAEAYLPNWLLHKAERALTWDSDTAAPSDAGGGTEVPAAPMPAWRGTRSMRIGRLPPGRMA